MPDTIRIFIKRPDVSLEPIEIPNTLEAFQELVDGLIEPIPMSRRLVAIVNEEGVLKNMPFNMYLGGHWLRGNILFVGVDGEEFTDVPFHSVRQIESAIREFNRR